MFSSNEAAVLPGCQVCQQRNDVAFCHLSADTLQALDQISYLISYPERATLFSEGQSCQVVFLLCSGRAKLSAAGRDGRRVLLRVAPAGQVVGLSSVLAGDQYRLTAETLAPSVVRIFKRSDFLHFVHSSSSTSLRALSTICQEYSTALDSLRSLALFPTASARVAQLLLQICSCEEAAGKPLRAKLLLTQEQIAQMTATSRETVTRLFSDLRRNRVISIRGTNLVIRDRAALERIAC